MMNGNTQNRKMRSYQHIIFFISLAITSIKAQTGGTTPDGDSYVCVPPGYCNNGGTPTTPGIDPRIVTPGELCPSGTIPCYTQGPSSRCGERFVSPVSTADGQATPGGHPWQAYLRNSTHPQYAGSGVLIDNYHVLTAAHKVYGDQNNPANVIISMGVHNPSDLTSPNVQTRTASAIRVHPNYDPQHLINDIAIVRVSSPFSLSQNNINSACLPTADASYTGQTCVVAGWGETNFGVQDHPTNPMKQVNLSPVDIATCRAGLLPVLPTVDTYLDMTGGEICAGGESMKDACTYDGGAPLTCPNTGKGNIAGLVIWGKSCGQPSVYGVYVSVPFYRAWIDSTITQLNNS
nr:PREDICTED: trypsin-1 [Tribolium castaneum]|eukprot:XP_015838443.1 PREDICTED: trypsin-1 [Tribolium castaneum]